MTATALWRRLDGPGHDTATLEPRGIGWRLSGTAVFLHPDGPAAVAYSLDLDDRWRSRGGTVRGTLAGRPVAHVMRRRGEEWYLDGAPMPAVAGLADLDYAFTPATNLPQVRRLALAPGGEAVCDAAWFDIARPGLALLRQEYERRNESLYAYRAPDLTFETELEIPADGFVARYGGLWQREA